MKKLSLRTLIQNLYSLWVYDYHKADNEINSNMKNLTQEIKWLKIQNAILHNLKDYECYPESQYILSASEPLCFPYPQIKHITTIKVQYDDSLKLPFILHKNKRLYFPHNYTIWNCENSYRNLIEQDQILGGGYLEKAPHCYQTDTFKVEQGDVLVDGGAAEGLFALDNIEKVSKAILIEADKKWIPALKATFAPWKDKVTIINKYLSNTDNIHQISLNTILYQYSCSCFVKMDIEGAEPSVLQGSKNVLQSRHNIRLVCCTYHYQEDAEKISQLFDEIGYEHAFSDGWMIFTEYDNPVRPFFRHGLIYGSASL